MTKRVLKREQGGRRIKSSKRRGGLLENGSPRGEPPSKKKKRVKGEGCMGGRLVAEGSPNRHKRAGKSEVMEEIRRVDWGGRGLRWAGARTCFRLKRTGAGAGEDY